MRVHAITNSVLAVLATISCMGCMPQPANGDPAPAAEPMDKKADPKPSPTGNAILDAHNAVRKKHCAAPLTWSKDLAKVAQKWADTLVARGCAFGHSNDRRYGENLAAGTEGAFTADQVVDMWYREREKYDFDDGGFSMETGHFTQVVWRSTKRVGCGSAVCKNLRIWVCNYDPPGNVEGRYRENVLPTSCRR